MNVHAVGRIAAPHQADIQGRAPRKSSGLGVHIGLARDVPVVDAQTPRERHGARDVVAFERPRQWHDSIHHNLVRHHLQKIRQWSGQQYLRNPGVAQPRDESAELDEVAGTILVIDDERLFGEILALPVRDTGRQSPLPDQLPTVRREPLRGALAPAFELFEALAQPSARHLGQGPVLSIVRIGIA